MHPLTQELFKTIERAKEHINIGAPKNGKALHDLLNWHEILAVYEGLGDEKSRETFSKVICLRTLFLMIPGNVASNVYSLYPKDVWAELCKEADTLPGVKGDNRLDKIETWILKGYEYKECKAIQDDFVFDIGAFTGNTALYFSKHVGERGKVFAFEPMEEIYNTLTENVKSIHQITTVNLGLSNKNETIFVASQNGIGSSIYIKGDVPIKVIALDNFIKENQIEHFDFLKIDIEGAEMDALEGAKNSIQRFTPKMAICIYHPPGKDMFQIYQRILSYNPKYSFYIKHSSPAIHETVLFCMPSNKEAKYTDCSVKYAEDVRIVRALYETYTKVIPFANQANKKQEEQTKRIQDLEDKIATYKKLPPQNDNSLELQNQITRTINLQNKTLNSINALQQSLDKLNTYKTKGSPTKALKNIALQHFLKKRAFALCNTNQLAEAENLAHSIIVNNPYMAWAYYILGRVQRKRKELDLALENYEKAINLEPSTTYFVKEREACLAERERERERERESKKVQNLSLSFVQTPCRKYGLVA